MEPIKFPDKFKPVFGPKRYKVLHGGRGGTKSWGVARFLLIKGTSEQVRVLCCREYQKSIKDSVLTLLSDQIERLGLGDHYKVLHNEIRGVNGTQFNFEGLSQNVQGIKSYEGVDYVWVEEGNAVTKRSWDILIPTIRKPGSEIWVTFNPEFEDDYAYERWVMGDDPMATVVEIGWQDNPWFPDVLNEERIAHKMRDPETYDHVWEGKPLKWLEGAIYAKQLRKAFEEERITKVPHDPESKVFTAWDLGHTDDTAIWWFQVIGGEIHIIDCYATSGGDPSEYVSQILGKHCQVDLINGEVKITVGDTASEIAHRTKYEYECHWLPHDAKAKTLAAHGKSIQEQLSTAFGWDKVRICPSLSREDGIMAARMAFPKMYFDKEKCQEGIKALRKYRREAQADDKSLKLNPKHDWTSHYADAFRYLGVSWEMVRPEDVEEKVPYVRDYFNFEEEESSWKTL